MKYLSDLDLIGHTALDLFCIQLIVTNGIEGMVSGDFR